MGKYHKNNYVSYKNLVGMILPSRIKKISNFLEGSALRKSRKFKTH
jgi:hypothetical protein